MLEGIKENYYATYLWGGIDNAVCLGGNGVAGCVESGNATHLQPLAADVPKRSRGTCTLGGAVGSCYRGIFRLYYLYTGSNISRFVFSCLSLNVVSQLPIHPAVISNIQGKADHQRNNRRTYLGGRGQMGLVD